MFEDFTLLSFYRQHRVLDRLNFKMLLSQSLHLARLCAYLHLYLGNHEELKARNRVLLSVSIRIHDSWIPPRYFVFLLIHFMCSCRLHMCSGNNRFFLGMTLSSLGIIIESCWLSSLHKSILYSLKPYSLGKTLSLYALVVLTMQRLYHPMNQVLL
jgi:hypothetical protein